MTFAATTISLFLVMLIGLLVHLLIVHPKLDVLFGPERNRLLDPLRVVVFLFTLLLPHRHRSWIGLLRQLAVLVSIICFVILFVTGFYPPVVLGEAISGYLLMLHTIAAGVFSVCIAFLAVACAQQCILAEQDFLSVRKWLSKYFHMNTNTDQPNQSTLSTSQKVLFWLVMVLMLPLVISIVLSMFKFFGTYWQHVLLDIHRYCALVLSLAAFILLYLTIIRQAKQE